MSIMTDIEWNDAVTIDVDWVAAIDPPIMVIDPIVLIDDGGMNPIDLILTDDGGEIVVTDSIPDETTVDETNTIIGTEGDDLLVGAATAEDFISIEGLAGNDTLESGAESDWLAGGTGDDTYIYGKGSGYDSIYDGDKSGAGGNDVVILKELAIADVSFVNIGGFDLSITVNETSESLYISGAFDASGYSTIESFQFSDGTLSLKEVSAMSPEVFYPIYYCGGSITINVDLGGEIQIDDGNVVSVGDESAIQLNNGGKPPIEISAGTGGSIDLIRGNIQLSSGNISITDGVDSVFNNITLVQKNLTPEADEHLSGKRHDDVLTGHGGNDDIKGGGGDDKLNGGSGKDKLKGGAGDDTLSGGDGNDVVTGGAGADTFVLSSLSGFDKIKDFKAGADVIALDHTLFATLTVGALSADSFVAGNRAVALDSDDYLLYDTRSGILSYDADGNGMEAAVKIALLGGKPELTAADFTVL